jgi:hypothetical protein
VEIKVDIQNTAKDLQQAYQVHYKKLYPYKSNMLLILAVASLLLALFPFHNSMFRIFFAIYGLGIGGFHFWRYNNLGAKVFKRNPQLGLPASFVISEEHLAYTSEGATGTLSWERYTQAIVTDTMVMLYAGQDSFVLFHSRFFKGNDFNSFREVVRKKVKTII